MINSEAPALGISLSHQIDQERSIVFQTHVERDVSDAQLNAVLDRVVKASERQSAKVRLPQLNQRLILEEQAFKASSADLERLDAESHERHTQSGRKGPHRYSEKDLTDRKNAVTVIDRRRDLIKSLHTQIAETQAAIDGDHHADDRPNPVLKSVRNG